MHDLSVPWSDIGEESRVELAKPKDRSNLLYIGWLVRPLVSVQQCERKSGHIRTNHIKLPILPQSLSCDQEQELLSRIQEWLC